MRARFKVHLFSQFKVRKLCPSRTHLRLATLSFGILTLSIGPFALRASAVRFYVDWQNGLSQFRAAPTLFSEPSLNATSGYGYASGLGLFMSPLPAPKRIDFQLGLYADSLLSTNGGFGTSLYTPLLVARVQVFNFYASVGGSPFVFSRTDPGGALFGFDRIIRNPSAIMLYTELGFLYAMTPKFSLGISVAPRFFLKESAWIWSPTTTGQLVLRFYWGLPSRGGGGASDSSFEYEGWRYIGK